MMVEAQVREFRYERKFLVEGLDAQQVHMLVARHPSMFYQPYPPRYVNNLYLDTEAMDNYYANVAGMADRHKVRIRWYGEELDHIEKPILEIKAKSGLVGTKYSYPFPEFFLDAGFSHRGFRQVISKSNLPADVRAYMLNLQVVLCNRYFRWYYASKDERFRVTVDAELEYFRVKRFGNRFVSRFKDQNHVVLELKYDKYLDPQAHRVAGFFPFIVTRNSKYVTGIERVYI
jgi:hypothetical protein